MILVFPGAIHLSINTLTVSLPSNRCSNDFLLDFVMNTRKAYRAFSYDPGLLSFNSFGHSSKYSSNYYPSLNNSAISSKALYLNFHAFDFNLTGIGNCYCSPS